MLVFDLVKHSQKPPTVSHTIRKKVEACFAAARGLDSKEIEFRHTGDGYICIFWDSSAVRILEFINHAFPLLKNSLSEFSQTYRAGIDFGILNPQQNELTHGAEHFDSPTIIAARLQSIAKENEILCSESCAVLFKSTHGELLESTALEVESKDRALRAHRVKLIDTDNLFRTLVRALRKDFSETQKYSKDRRHIMVVDDEPAVLQTSILILEKVFPNCIVESYENPKFALTAFVPKKYLLVITDQLMPFTNGTELTRIIREKDEDQIVVLQTGFYNAKISVDFIKSGGSIVIQKPFTPSEQTKRLLEALHSHELQEAFRQLGAFCDDPAKTIHLIRLTADSFEQLIHRTRQQDHLAASLLRHKAQNILGHLQSMILAGRDLDQTLAIAFAQLSRISRFADVFGRAELKDLAEFITQYFLELRRLHKKIDFSLRVDLLKIEELLAISSLVVLAVVELVDNAIDAVGSGGGKVCCEIETLSTLGILSVTIVDSGPGVDNDYASKLFSYGTSTKGIGRGNGLAMIRELLSVSGGDCQHLEGSMFRVTVPLKAIKDFS